MTIWVRVSGVRAQLANANIKKNALNITRQQRALLGSTGVSPVGFSVSEKRTSFRKYALLRSRNRNQSPSRRHAATNTRDACAPQNCEWLIRLRIPRPLAAA